MRTREEQISGLGERINRGCHDLPLSQILARNYIQEAEQRVRAEMSVGYIFHNPDTGAEILPYHPVESGECLDAQDIRQATAEVLREELVSTWEEMANEHHEREKRGEESRKDSDRLDWLGDQCVHVYAPSQCAGGIGCGVCLATHKPEIDHNLRKAIDAAMGK